MNTDVSTINTSFLKPHTKFLLLPLSKQKVPSQQTCHVYPPTEAGSSQTWPGPKHAPRLQSAPLEHFFSPSRITADITYEGFHDLWRLVILQRAWVFQPQTVSRMPSVLGKKSHCHGFLVRSQNHFGCCMFRQWNLKHRQSLRPAAAGSQSPMCSGQWELLEVLSAPSFRGSLKMSCP